MTGFFRLDDIIDELCADAESEGIDVNMRKLTEWLYLSIDEILHFHVPNIRNYVFSNEDKLAILRIAREKEYKF